MSALSCVICYSSSFLHRKFVLASFLLVLRYSSSSFHRAFEMYEFLRVFDVIWLERKRGLHFSCPGEIFINIAVFRIVFFMYFSVIRL